MFVDEVRETFELVPRCIDGTYEEKRPLARVGCWR